MDEDRRTRLTEKRRLAQLRRERAAVSATFRRVARGLCGRGVRFSKLVPERCREALGPLASGPGRDERLLWSPIPNGTCARWQSEAERDALLREALAGCTDSAARVAVIWHPFEAGLTIGAADLAAHAPLVLAESADTIWIVAANGGPWLIELAYWDREVCWTPRMPVFVG
jgi:hypothetical protein